MEKAFMSGMMAVVMMLVLATVVQGMQPAPPQYTCPICGGKFYTYDELYQHFITEHPSQPIEIIWT